MAVLLSALRRLYLSLYNWTVFLGWYPVPTLSLSLSLSLSLLPTGFDLCFRFQVLYLALKTLNESGHQHVYSAVERPLLLAQSAAVLEVLLLLVPPFAYYLFFEYWRMYFHVSFFLGYSLNWVLKCWDGATDSSWASG